MPFVHHLLSHLVKQAPVIRLFCPAFCDLPAGNLVEYLSNGQIVHFKPGEASSGPVVIEPRRGYFSGVAFPFFPFVSTVRLVSLEIAVNIALTASPSVTSMRSAGRHGSSAGSFPPVAPT